MKRRRPAGRLRPARESSNQPADPPDRRRATISAAHRADACALVALDERCFPAADRFPSRTWRHLLGPATARGSALILVARTAHIPVGAIVGLMRATSRVLRIYSLAVDPAARGQRLGQRLIRALVAAAPRRCTVVALEVRSDNPARGLYDKLGMRVTDTLPGYYADGAAGVRYAVERRTLSR